MVPSISVTSTPTPTIISTIACPRCSVDDDIGIRQSFGRSCTGAIAARHRREPHLPVGVVETRKFPASVGAADRPLEIHLRGADGVELVPVQIRPLRGGVTAEQPRAFDAKGTVGSGE